MTKRSNMTDKNSIAFLYAYDSVVADWQRSGWGAHNWSSSNTVCHANNNPEGEKRILRKHSS